MSLQDSSKAEVTRTSARWMASTVECGADWGISRRSSDELHFESTDRGGMHAWVGRRLIEQGYSWMPGRVGKGVAQRYVAKNGQGLSQAPDGAPGCREVPGKRQSSGSD